MITTYGGPGSAGCSWTKITYYSDGSTTTGGGIMDCPGTINPQELSPEINSKTEDCTGGGGEIGVLMDSAIDKIAECINLTTTQTNSLYGSLFAFKLKNYLTDEENNCIPEAKGFGELAIEAWLAGGEVDFEARLINNPGLHDFLKSRMSPNESTLFETLSIIQKAASEAYAYAEIFYPNPVRNRKGDAVKHTLWNALSTNYIGASLTKQLTDAHEVIVYEPDYPNHYKETEMDLFNNAKGRELATQYGSFIFQLVENALENGELRYLNNLVFLNGFYNATNSSQLISTIQ